MNKILITLNTVYYNIVLPNIMIIDNYLQYLPIFF